MIIEMPASNRVALDHYLERQEKHCNFLLTSLIICRKKRSPNEIPNDIINKNQHINSEREREGREKNFKMAIKKTSR